MDYYGYVYQKWSKSPIRLFEVGLIGLDLVHQGMDKLNVIQEMLNTT